MSSTGYATYRVPFRRTACPRCLLLGLRREPLYDTSPIESNVTAKAEARDRISAASARFFIDPRGRDLQTRGHFFGCENVLGLERGAEVKEVAFDRVGDFGLITGGPPRPCERAIKEVTHRVHV